MLIIFFSSFKNKIWYRCAYCVDGKDTFKSLSICLNNSSHIRMQGSCWVYLLFIPVSQSLSSVKFWNCIYKLIFFKMVRHWKPKWSIFAFYNSVSSCFVWDKIRILAEFTVSRLGKYLNWSKYWLFWDQNSRKFFISRDIKIHLDSFYF